MKGIPKASKFLIPLLLCLIVYFMWQNTLIVSPYNYLHVVQKQPSSVRSFNVEVDTDLVVNKFPALLPNVKWPPFTFNCAERTIQEIDPQFTTEEKENITQCIKTFDSVLRKDSKKFWFKDTRNIRTKYHTYLNSESVILDIGGNVGKDAENLLVHKPKAYFLFEPVVLLYNKLVNKFQNTSDVYVYNFGLSKKDQTFEVDYKGQEGDATSMFESSKFMGRKMSLKTFNASNVFLDMGIPCIEPDLITINCEGCEFEVLENLLYTGMAKHFKHIQFASHPKITRIPDVKNRYCQIQALLRRSHFIGYHYFGCWETWIRTNT